MDLNKVCLLGRLGDDPKIRVLPSGDKVATFSVATSEKWKSKNGEPQERTEWSRCECFGRLAETIEQYAFKGQRVYVEGKKVTEQFTSKEGVLTNVVKIKIDNFGGQFIMLSSPEGSRAGEQRAPKPEPKPAAKPKPADGGWGSDDDVPF